MRSVAASRRLVQGSTLLKTGCHRLVSPPLRPTESRTHCCSILETKFTCLLLADESCKTIRSREDCKNAIKQLHPLLQQCSSSAAPYAPSPRWRTCQHRCEKHRCCELALARDGRPRGRRRGTRRPSGRAATSTPGTRSPRIESSRCVTWTRPASTSRSASANPKLN